MQAESTATTNLVDLATVRRERNRVVEVDWPERPTKTPELALFFAVVAALPAAQRSRVKTALRRMHLSNPSDQAALAAHLYIGSKL